MRGFQYTKQSWIRRALISILMLAALALLFAAAPPAFASEPADEEREESPVWWADMLVVEYTDVSIGAASADLFSNVGGTADLQVKSLWYYTPDRELRLEFTEGVAGTEDLTLQVGDLKLAFPAGSSGNSVFRWKDVDVDWEDGQTIPVRIGRNALATGSPSISGTIQVGKTLTADTTNIADEDGPDDATFSYQWVSNDGNTDADIQDATEASYTLLPADWGKTIKVRVSFTDGRGFAESLTSAATAEVAPPTNSPATGAPSISGTVLVGGTLTASTSDIEDANGLDGVTFSYQWLSVHETSETEIEGATDATYSLLPADSGKTISVLVSFNDRYGYPESRTSAPTEAVVTPNSRATGAPTISGELRVREILTVDTSGIADGNGRQTAVFNYQWVRNDGTTGTDVQGATGKTYELSEDEVGHTMKVQVFFTDDAGFAESLTSVSTAKVAPLGKCLEADLTPTPTTIEVEAVPIVVESTTEEYFVLYVRPDLDSDSEIPVSVTLGQDGATTLAENAAPLPREHYRVEKYSVAAPGDVDGDCIDDITELEDPVGMNPLNPVPSVRFVDGALAIPDRETFEALSYRSEIHSIEPYLADLEFIKFLLSDIDTDHPAVYFTNTQTHKTHVSFHDSISHYLNPSPMRRNRILGEIVFHPNVVAPDGSLGVYRFQFNNAYSFDDVARTVQINNAYSFDVVARTYELLAASMPLLDNNLAYHPIAYHQPADYPIPGAALERYHEEQALYDGSRVNVLLQEDILPDIEFIPFNLGEGYGFLRKMSLEERADPRDVVIYEALPNELSRVAGIITTVPQTPLSHVNLRAVQDGVPNAFIRDALDDDIADLIGSYVHYGVTESGYTVRAATPEEFDAHFAASRPAAEQAPQRDLTVTGITALSGIEFDDWDAFGVKAANVAVLRRLGFPDGTVPDGFAVPFYFYDEFMKHNGFYDDIGEMLADTDFQTDFDTQESKLKKLRKKIKKGETPGWMSEALEEMHAAFPEGRSLRYRSSTNNEDLPGFSGAGLYDSKTQDPDETEEDGIAKSLKQVYASLWNFRAFTEREFHRIDHLAAAMGVLVHPNYSDELANGVAVSFDPFYGTDSYYVNTQLGEDMVTNPDAYSVPEEIMLRQTGTYDVIMTSNQVPRGQLLMSDAQIEQLRGHLKVIHDEFAKLYGIEAGEAFAMEIEFKITSDDVLAIKQARPWVFNSVSAAAPTDNSPATGAPTITGTVQVGETLTADTSAIDDEDGLDNAVFSYQWLADDAIIQDATNSTYTLVTDDVGKAIKVRVSFTDDATNAATLTSAATAAVAATVPGEPEHLNVSPHDDEALDLYWDPPASDGGSPVTGYRVQWKEAADSWDTPEDVSEATVTGTTHTINGLTGGGEYAFRVMASNEVGEGPASAEQTGILRETRAPEMVRPRVDGANMRVVYDEALDEGSAPPADAFDVRVVQRGSGELWQHEKNRRGVDSVSIDGDTVVLTLASAVTSKDVVVIIYTPPSDETSPRVRDAAGNAAAAIIPTQAFNDTEEVSEEEEPAQNSPATGAPTISGTAQVGETLTANTTGISDEDGLTDAVFSYQWLADDADIQGETASTYTLVTDDVDKAIKVRVSFDDDAGNEETLNSAATAAVAAKPNSLATGAPTISGTVQVGETLTAATTGIADKDGLTNAVFAYQWLADDADIQGETAYTYTLVTDDVDKAIKVRVSFDDDAGNEETLNSAATAAVAAKPNSLATGAPTISGTVQVGETLTANTTGIADKDGLDNAVFGYQWLADDADIQGETASTYTLVTDDVGKAIKVRVIFTDDATNEETLTSAATAAVAARPNSPATGAPTISGTAQVGETLTAHTTGIADEDGLTNAVFAYQWLADDAIIQDATASTYTLVTDDVDKAIKVRVSFTDDATNEETLTSAATAAVAARPNSLATGAPTISGTVQVGETLTANTTGISDEDGLTDAVFSYQWLADDADIQGETASTYTLVTDDVGKAIKVRVTFTDDATNEETLTSAATAADSSPPPRDEYDKHGDTPETATDILFGPQYRGRIQPRQDQDWFRLDVEPDQAGYTEIYFDETSRAPYSRLALYDSSGSCMVGECEFDNGRFGTLKVYLDPGVYFLRVTGPVDDSLPTSVEVNRKYRIAWQRPWDKAWYDECAAIETGFDDPLYGCQTNLINQAHPGEHINVAPVWEQGILGEDIIVALVDFGVDQSHEDLVGSIDLAHSTTYPPDSGRLYSPEEDHGTSMAGIIGAQHNSLGIRGIAPKSLIYSYYHPSDSAFNTTFRHKVGASLAPHTPDIAVSSNSWTFTIPGILRPMRQYTEGPILDGITRGFHGKGTVYVMGVDPFINSNYYDTKTLYAVVPVCGVGRDGKLAERPDGRKTNWMGYGANLWICAPYQVITTDLNNGYHQYGGTSSATASVSGVVALVRSVNPDLTWRDVKLILAASARQNDPEHQDWGTGAPHYGGGPGRYHFNDNYGFGVVDAAAAVSLAKSWTNLPPMTEAQSSTPTDYSEDIPEDPLENDGPLQVWFEIADDGQTTPQFVEHVEIDIAFDHPSFHDLDVRLTSPSGTVSRLSWPDGSGWTSIDHSHSFGSSKHLGENPVGQWQLSVIDLKRPYRGKLNASSLTIRGHRHAGAPPANSPATGAPTISGNAQVGETLTVSTSAISDQDGTSAATFAYQWISNGADTNSDIEGADGSAYIPTPADAGSVITVRVTFTDDLGQGETLTSLPTRAVAPLNTSATGAPVISGTAQVGETLTADTSGIADEDGIESADFQLLWLADDVGIRWDASYTLQASEVGKSIQLRVFFTDDRGNEEMLTSAATAAVAYVDGPPGAPREVEVKAGDKELLVSWLPPAEENKAPVEQYRILYTKEGGSDQELHTTQLSQVIGNLTGGVPYRVQVTAKNAAGYGTPSDEMSETPDTIPLWSADMLVVEYTDVSIGADSADLILQRRWQRGSSGKVALVLHPGP